MKKFILSMATLALIFGVSGLAQADGCYICKGGGYVKHSGSDDASKRKAAKNCGCEISGTRSSCDAANLKILCTVKKETQDKFKLAQK